MPRLSADEVGRPCSGRNNPSTAGLQLNRARGGRQKTEGRRQKAEGGREKAEGGNQSGCSSGFCSSASHTFAFRLLPLDLRSSVLLAFPFLFLLFSVFRSLPSAFFALPSVFSLLPAVFCLLPADFCLLPSAFGLRPSAFPLLGRRPASTPERPNATRVRNWLGRVVSSPGRTDPHVTPRRGGRSRRRRSDRRCGCDWPRPACR